MNTNNVITFEDPARGHGDLINRDAQNGLLKAHWLQNLFGFNERLT